MFTCTLQGFSGTQGNPVKFTAKTFAVCLTDLGIRASLKMYAFSMANSIHGLKLAILKPHLSTLRSYWKGCVIVMGIFFDKKYSKIP